MSYYYSDEEFLSDEEELISQEEIEQHYDDYFNIMEKTFDEIKEYIKDYGSNKNLLQNSMNYLDLNQIVLYDEDSTYELSNNFINIINKKYEDDNMPIPLPSVVNCNYNIENNNFKVIKDKSIKTKKQSIEQYKIRKQKRDEKRKYENELKRKEMYNRTKNILNRYFPNM